MNYFYYTSVEWRTFDWGIRFVNEFVYQTSLQHLYPILSERCLNVVLTSYSNVHILNVGLRLSERRLNVVWTL